MAGSLDASVAARPFADLPAGLVGEVLAGATQVGSHLLGDFTRIKQEKAGLRKKLDDARLVGYESDLPSPHIPKRLVLRMAPTPSSACWRLISLQLQPLLSKALLRRVRLGTRMFRTIGRLFEPRSITMALKRSCEP